MIGTTPPSESLSEGFAVDSRSFRSRMSVTKKWAYFDHAAVGPLPDPARLAMERFVVQANEQGDTVWPEWSGQVEGLRSDMATWLGASSDEIALVPNTTTGIGLIAEGWRWRPGDSVVVPANEFPSNMLPWRNLVRRGVDVRIVPVGPNGELVLESLLNCIDSSTRMVALSWVGFVSGWRIDVSRFCEAIHARGALVFLDAIQGLGVFPLSVEETGVDFLCADGHKWMLGPEGAGTLYIRKSHLDSLDPLNVGWHSLDGAAGFDPNATVLKSSASRYEGGSANMPGMIGLGASVRLLMSLGAHRSDSGFGEAVLANVESLSSELRRIGVEVHLPPSRQNRSGIMTCQLPGHDPNQVRKFCTSRGIATSVRAGRLRLSTHAYNNSDDIERLVSALQEFSSQA